MGRGQREERNTHVRHMRKHIRLNLLFCRQRLKTGGARRAGREEKEIGRKSYRRKEELRHQTLTYKGQKRRGVIAIQGVNKKQNFTSLNLLFIVLLLIAAPKATSSSHQYLFSASDDAFPAVLHIEDAI